MRIIAGKFRGRRLQSPSGRHTRPTTDRVREAVFDLLATRTSVRDAHVLDLFCGTGAFGLEALSRGAAEAVFVDSARDALRTAAANAGTLGIEAQCRFLQRDGMRYLKSPSTPSFDLIFADPPYAFKSLSEIPAFANRILLPDGLLVIEHDPGAGFEGGPQEIESRSYGRTIVTIFRASPRPASHQAETT